jgi:hypothetical protein
MAIWHKVDALNKPLWALTNRIIRWTDPEYPDEAYFEKIRRPDVPEFARKQA